MEAAGRFLMHAAAVVAAAGRFVSFQAVQPLSPTNPALRVRLPS